MPQTHPPYNDSSRVGTGMWSLETLCYNVFRPQEVLEGLLDLKKGLAKAHCVNYVTSSSRALLWSINTDSPTMQLNAMTLLPAR